MRNPKRAMATIAALAVVAAACSSGNDSSTPPEATPEPTVSLAEPEATATPQAEAQTTPTPPAPSVPGALPSVDVPSLPGDEVALAFDPDVRTGTLDNGLTYYIRRNTAPGARAELRLAVNAGSALEDDDQSGVAHFLEHMLFNGTERYPANELIAVLEAFGTEFGPDVNAYTSLDETVYELSVPTDDRALFIEAFDVMAEWASKATIDPDEVIAERGVVLEEWRQRDQGVSGRIGEVVQGMLTPGTPYEGRLPIGTEDAIVAMSADVVARFYSDWYRPDLMAIVVVGDIDVDDVAGLIQERFAPLTGPDDPRPVPPIELTDADDFGYAMLADPEMPNAFVQVFYEGPARPLETIGDYRRAVAGALASDMIAARFDDDVSRGVAPFLSAGPSALSIARDLDAPSLVAEAPAAQLGASLEALLVELERVRRDGFTTDEFQRAVDRYRTGVEQAYAGRGTTQDVDYAAEYVDHYLGAVPSISWDDFLAIETQLLDEMTPDYVVAAYLDRLAGRAPQVLVIGPESDAADLPTQQDAQRIIAEVTGGDVAPREDDADAVDALMARPEPAEIVERSRIAELGADLVRFSNGVTVLIKPTEIQDNFFGIGGLNPGGTSVLEPDDLAAAFVAPDVITSSGVGPVDQVELDRFLANAVASVAIGFDDTAESIDAGGSTEDAELVFQLLHQYLVAPAAQDAALSTVNGELAPFAADPASLPFLATTVTLLDIRYGGDPYYAFLPPADDLAAVTSADVERVYTRLLGDAAGSVYAIVGDIDPAVATDLAARYLGTLPSTAQAEDFIDRQPPPPGVVAETVEVGQDPQAEVTVVITAEREASLSDEIEIDVLENLLATRVRDRLREALGATYAPVVLMGADQTPDALVETFIQVSGDPERIDELIDEIDGVLASVRSQGFTATEVATAREQVRRDYELVSNEFWIGQLLRAGTDRELTMLSVRQRVDTAAAVDQADIAALVASALPADEVITVAVVPAG